MCALALGLRLLSRLYVCGVLWCAGFSVRIGMAVLCGSVQVDVRGMGTWGITRGPLLCDSLMNIRATVYSGRANFRTATKRCI
jgi:hypothetical protein